MSTTMRMMNITEVRRAQLFAWQKHGDFVFNDGILMRTFGGDCENWHLSALDMDFDCEDNEAQEGWVHFQHCGCSYCRGC